MTRRFSRPGLRSVLALLVSAALLPVPGCSPDSILEVTDPDIILEANSASGALALKNGVLLRLSQATDGVQGADALFLFGGLLTDEWRSGDTFVQRNNMDQRIWEPNNTFLENRYRDINRVRVEGEAAINALRAYLPTPASNIGLMFALIAYAENLIAEYYCNGAPVSSVVGGQIVFGGPVSNDSFYVRAINHADSALANLAGPDSAKVRQLASLVKGRALLNRNQFTTAAAAVASVATAFEYAIFHSVNTNTNQNWALNNSAKRYTMVEREGNCPAGAGFCAGVGLDYISANDPRLPRRTGPDRTFDSALPELVTRQGIFWRYGTTPIATGIEGRLIQAEAALRNNDVTGWLSIINSLRTNTALYPTMDPLNNQQIPEDAGFVRGPDLTALGDSGARNVDVHFRERAFWMWGTGHRLGDMRRLLRQFIRTEAEVYPTGSYYKGGTYGNALQLPVPFVETNNPNFVQCTDRLP